MLSYPYRNYRWKNTVSIIFMIGNPWLEKAVFKLRRVPAEIFQKIQLWRRLLYLVCGPLARYVKLRVVRAPWMPGTLSPPPQFSDPDMHQGTCVTHVPWCMSWSLASVFLRSRWRKNVPGIPGACATHNFTYLARGPWLSSDYGKYQMPIECSKLIQHDPFNHQCETIQELNGDVVPETRFSSQYRYCLSIYIGIPIMKMRR